MKTMEKDTVQTCYSLCVPTHTDADNCGGSSKSTVHTGYCFFAKN